MVPRHWVEKNMRNRQVLSTTGKSKHWAVIFLSGIGCLFFVGDTSVPAISFIVPSVSDSTSYDRGKVFIVSASKDIGEELVLSTQWQSTNLIDISTREAKDNFPKTIYKLLAPQSTLELLSYSFKYFKGYTAPESLAFAYADTLTVKGLWRQPQFAQLVKRVQLSTDISDVLLMVRGWNDSTYISPYDDPSSGDRTLYKFHVRLVPGKNTIYCAPIGRKDQAIAFVTTFAMESKPSIESSTLFHNSMLEQSCISCHEGLPSSVNGKSMSADCNVCHKLMSEGGSYLHAPAEMKECESCHRWSAEQRAVVVNKDVPALCYDCHNEKKAQVENSVSVHPIAGDCLTCHATHGSEEKHVMKEDVYSLCTSCHEEQSINHPVGRHPLRFAQLGNGDEISCISCHNPHGSETENLLNAPGGRMGICEQCH